MIAVNQYLSENPNAIHILKQNIHEICWFALSANPSIFEYDYQAMKDRIYNSGLCEEFMSVMFHPDNARKFAGWGFEDMVPDGS